ncbi:MAG: biotin/lipoyl-containing protein, partial [Spirochaetaceae bacterium]
MIEEVTLPEISENVESGNVISVLVSEGERVSEDQPLLEIETDKASVEVPSTTAGTVKEILVSEGEDVKVGAVIA